MSNDKLNREMVVKVQIPLMTNGDPEALIYNEDRSFETYWPVDDTMRKLMRGTYKKFFLVDVTPSRKLNFIKQVPDPGW